jgi:hypothetical protein
MNPLCDILCINVLGSVAQRVIGVRIKEEAEDYEQHFIGQ